ncbi:MAG: hypothetical protein HONBIEJF_00961 [Fimbriimonadaceae bacterium]|nr:hypothetical protein [Fimbriimonadaceae bacterium]
MTNRLVLKLVTLAGAATAVTQAGAVTLWDTGAPHTVIFNGSETYLGYSSGNLDANNQQRWAAVPFRIGAGGAVIKQVNVDWFVVAGSEADAVNYIIWKRSGLAAPVDGDQVSSGVLGKFGVGIDDPRTSNVDDWLHQYTGLNIGLAAGDYYLSIYGDGGTAPNNCAWLTGGDLQDESLEQAFMWRSALFPNPGFVQYAPGTILPGTGMSDADDRWNPSFSLEGDIVPEPMTMAALASGFVALAWRRRK